MKLAKESNLFPGTKDFYMLSAYKIDKIRKRVNLRLCYYEHIEDGTLSVGEYEHAILDKPEYIVDPNWNEDSDPPKPLNFDPLDPSTWGALSFDDIPKALDPSKLFATRVINAINQGIENPEKPIFDALIDMGVISRGTKWQYL